MTVDPTPAGRAPSGRLLGLLLAVWLLPVFHLAGSVIDDTYITLRFARNLADGQGLVFNPGTRVEGYTNFLWVLIAAAADRLGLPPLLVLPAVSCVAGGLMIVVSYRAARALERSPELSPAGAGLAAAFILALASGDAMYVNAGMETLFFALLVSTAGLAAVFRRPVVFGVCIALAFLTRPEAALPGIAGFALFALRPATRARRLRDLARAALPVALLVLPYLAFKYWYFGTVLPNTLAAKRPDVFAGGRYVGEYLLPAAGILAAAIVSAVARPDARRRELLGLFALCTVAVTLEGGDWMPAHRLLVPWLPWLAVAADEALVRWLTEASRVVASGRARALGLVALVSLGAWATVNVREVMFLHGWYASLDTVDTALTGFALQVRVAGVHRLALFDIGRVGYMAHDVEIVDLAGLTDPVIAHAAGGYGSKRIPMDYLARRDPDLVVTDSFYPVRRQTPGGPVQVLTEWPVEQYLLGTPWLAAHYQYRCTVHAERMYFHVFARTTGVGPLGVGPCVPAGTVNAAELRPM